MRVVPSLAEWPQVDGRVAWRTTLAFINARGREDAGELSMSAVIPPGDLSGLLPEEDIATLRGLMLDPDEAPDAAALRARLEHPEPLMWTDASFLNLTHRRDARPQESGSPRTRRNLRRTRGTRPYHVASAMGDVQIGER